MVNPDEVKEAANYIRFLNRSTGKVRTGPGAGREDVNVSCKGGTRVEIKGVSHNKWIPELTHVEVFRQWALLAIKDKLKKSVKNQKNWKINYEYLDFDMFEITYEPIKDAKDKNQKLVAINLPGFAGILSHFTQPTKCFADEIKDRLKVIACLEKPNMVHTEDFEPIITDIDIELIAPMLKANENDAQIIIWGPEEDMETALEVIEERCQMAFKGVPEETRKSFADGSTIFERVLPGADRMYPDTDSPPIPLEGKYIDKLAKGLPVEVFDRYKQLQDWNIPSDTYDYLLKNNLVPLIEKIVNKLKIDAKFVGTFLGHKLKHIEGKFIKPNAFEYEKVYELFAFIKKEKLNINIAKYMMILLYQHPQMEFNSLLSIIKYKKRSKEEIIAPISFLKEKYKEIGKKKDKASEADWVMGEIRKQALGNIDLVKLRKEILN
jgi:glutamyl-tRNA(Gln) amidotransferase subunit E